MLLISWANDVKFNQQCVVRYDCTSRSGTPYGGYATLCKSPLKNAVIEFNNVSQGQID